MWIQTHVWSFKFEFYPSISTLPKISEQDATSFLHQTIQFFVFWSDEWLSTENHHQTSSWAYKKNPQRTDREKESEGNVRFLYIITVITVDDLCIRKSWGKYRLSVITHARTHARTHMEKCTDRRKLIALSTHTTLHVFTPRTLLRHQ